MDIENEKKIYIFSFFFFLPINIYVQKNTAPFKRINYNYNNIKELIIIIRINDIFLLHIRNI